ncbi:site-specific DNA-methyltransferase [uncultured Microbacterium sp.]|uniref:DNA-methyltransferase n=1 Tax=uncultured Microbacterium sp. TaxID=191216 RepID=UPI0028EDDD4B|nr:site-specific DNA-methyltransferase [uncultured Microbacterium sp.]
MSIYYEDDKVTLHHGDCLDIMPNLSPTSVNMVLADLPYGTTSNKWDAVIDTEAMWDQYLRVGVDNAAFVFTASQPFTSTLVLSRPKLFRHEWVWIKNRGSNFANTVREPMKEHESVLVFSRGKWTYNKQMQERTGGGADRVKYDVAFNTSSENYRQFEGRDAKQLPNLRVPSSWQKFNTEVGLHPTQKPVDLMRYLIRTYSNDGDVVMDNTAGSGTTLVAAVAEGRRAIGIERDEAYCEVIAKRLASSRQEQVDALF